ncbi:MAG: hypothetical protein QOI91_1471 [Solirubrobacteraceae bacterium]|jgi:Uma2 family endonuclease|nr:hypothetical protein [Solirubrobacteraceae bacterium]
MPAVPAAPTMTAEEFLALPVSETAAFRELVDGELLVNDPTLLHNEIQSQLLVALRGWTNAAPDRGRAYMPADVGLDERNVYKPDVLWYAAGRVPDVHSPPPYPLPDLALEIRSPSTGARDVGAKKTTYERFGLPELWLVDTAAEQVLVFRRSGATATHFDVELELERGERLESPLLPGFALELDALFDVD